MSAPKYIFVEDAENFRCKWKSFNENMKRTMTGRSTNHHSHKLWNRTWFSIKELQEAHVSILHDIFLRVLGSTFSICILLKRCSKFITYKLPSIHMSFNSKSYTMSNTFKSRYRTQLDIALPAIWITFIALCRLIQFQTCKSEFPITRLNEKFMK